MDIVYYPKNLPLFAVLGFIAFGVLLSFSGPVTYVQYDKLIIAEYITGFMILFAAGYFFGALPKNVPNFTVPERLRYFDLTLKIVKICLVIFALAQTFSVLRGLAVGSLNLSISNLGEAYTSAYDSYERNTGNYSLDFIIQTLTYLPYLVSIILGAYLFKFLPLTYRLLVVYAFLSVILLQTIGAGKQKQIADIFVVLIILQIVNFNKNRLSIKPKTFLVLVALALAGICALVYILSLRYQAIGIDASNVTGKMHPLMGIDFDHSVFSIFGEDLGLSISFLSSYFSQGYYGLSLAMQESFVWTYFVGNSYSLTVFLERFLDLPLDYRNTYAFRAGEISGWSEAKWYSAFSWFAGDLTFAGTLVFFGMLAYLYASVWRAAMIFRNPIAVMLFVNLSIGFLYIPANNQLLHTPGSVIAVFAMLLAWIFVGHRFNFPRESKQVAPRPRPTPTRQIRIA